MIESLSLHLRGRVVRSAYLAEEFVVRSQELKRVAIDQRDRRLVRNQKPRMVDIADHAASGVNARYGTRCIDGSPNQERKACPRELFLPTGGRIEKMNG